MLPDLRSLPEPPAHPLTDQFPAQAVQAARETGVAAASKSEPSFKQIGERPRSRNRGRVERRLKALMTAGNSA